MNPSTLLSLLLAGFLLAATAAGTPFTFQLTPFGSSDLDGIPDPQVVVDVPGAEMTQFTLNLNVLGATTAFAGSAIFRDPNNPLDTTLISFSGEIDNDPFISWSFSAVTSGTPKSLSTTFTTGVAPGLYSQLTSGFSGSMGDLQGNGVSTKNIIVKGFVPIGTEIASVTLTGDCVQAKGPPAGNYPCPPTGQFGPVSTLLPPASYPSMAASLAFDLSANDAATFQGQLILAELLIVPEPATMVLIGCGLFGMAMLVRRGSNKNR